MLIYFQPYRIYNTWLGDPTKVILLEKALEIIRRDNLLEQVRTVGKALQGGLRQLEVNFFFHLLSLSSCITEATLREANDCFPSRV